MWVLQPWRPGFRMRWAEARSVARFGLALSGYGVVNYFSRNGSGLVIGRFLGSTALGYYQNGFLLMFYPQQVITALVSSVALPPLSRVQHDNERFRAGILNLSALLAILLFPVMLGLVVTSDLVVAVVLGSKWRTSAPVLSILAVTGLIQAASASTVQIFTAKGRTDILFRWSIITGGMGIVSFLAGLHWGIQGVAAGYALVTIALLLPLLRSALRLIGMTVETYCRALAPILAVTLGMAVCVSGWRLVMMAAGVGSSLWLLITSVTVGVASYGALAFWAWPAAVRSLVQFVSSTDIAPMRRAAQLLLQWRERAATAERGVGEEAGAAQESSP
jgi:PST family polysaccharide transporter